jgi:hypothetical protein
MQQRFITIALAALATTACVAHRGERMVTYMPEPGLGTLHMVAAIPAYNADSATHDTNSVAMHALVGTVVNSDSGQPLGATEILIRRPGDGKIISIITDMRGGFVVPRIPPGDYALIVRRVGYESIGDIRSAHAGEVDTLRLKLTEARVFLRGPKWRVASSSY